MMLRTRAKSQYGNDALVTDAKADRAPSKTNCSLSSSSISNISKSIPYKKGSPNPAYRLFRRALADLGLDQKELSTPRWNPFAGVVREGDTVVIKPNFVLHRNASDGPLEAVVTHPSVLRVVVDYVLIALQGRGRIIIADTPQMDCNWKMAGAIK